MTWHPLLWPPSHQQQQQQQASVKVLKACHGLTRAVVSAASEAQSLIQCDCEMDSISFPVSHNKFTRVMIGVWAGCSQRTWLFISNGQQFAHLSAHTAQYTPILLFFYPSLPTISLSITPTLYLYHLLSVILPPLFLPPALYLFLYPLLPSFSPHAAISPYWGHCPGSSRKVPLAAAECISMGEQWEPGDRPEDTSAMAVMHWLGAQCSTLWPGQAPEGSGHTHKHARTQEIKSADRRAWACINKCTMKFCLDRCPEIPKCWRICTHKYIQGGSAVHWDTPGPCTVSSYVHIEIQTTAHFPASIWNTKTPSTLWPPVLCQDKICFLPTPSSVCLSFPKLYLPHIIVNCLLCDIYCVRRRDSQKHTHTLGGFCRDTGSAAAVSLTMMNGEETGWDGFVFVGVCIDCPPEQNGDNAFNGSISINFTSKTCTGMCAETHTVTASFVCPWFPHRLLLPAPPSQFTGLDSLANRCCTLASLSFLVHILFHTIIWCQGHVNECLSPPPCTSYFPKSNVEGKMS